jgi:predicted PurR-regulated permease PerM
MHAEARDWTLRGASVAVGVGVVVGAVVLAAAALPVLVLVFLTVLFGAALEPLVALVRRRAPIGRAPAILVVYATFLVAVIGLVLFVVPAAFTQAQRALSELPLFLARTQAWASELEPAAVSNGLTSVIGAIERSLQPAVPDPDVVVEAGLTVAEVLVSVASLLALVFFWLLEHARLRRYVLAFVPRSRRAGARSSWRRVERRLGRWVRGQLILMGAIFVATAIAYSVLGVPGALLLALIAGLFEAIPIVGPLLGAIPALVVAATVSPELAVVVLVVYVVIQAVEGNVLIPIVMRNTIGLSPFVVLVSLLVGATVAGIPGAFLAVPLAAVAEIVLENFQARTTPVAPDPGARVEEEADEGTEGGPDVEVGGVADGGPADPTGVPRVRVLPR